jgi:hypothetical protein
MIRSSETVTKISAAWVAAAKDMPNIDKTGTGNYGKYVPLGEIVETVRPILADHELAYLQGVSDGDKVVTVTTRLVHSSGEWFEDALTLPTGQNTAQAVGSAVTYGRRYGLMAILGLAPEDDDGAAASASAPKAARTPAKAASKPPPPTTHTIGDGGGTITNGRATQIILELRKHGIEHHEDRVAELSRILETTVVSTNDLTNAQAAKVMEHLTSRSA